MIKILQIIIVANLFCTSLLSQFISTNKKWKTSYPIYNTLIGELVGETTRTYFFEGDTTINLIEYAKMYYYTDSIQNSNSVKTYFAAFRNDGKKIYQKKHSNSEDLIYDFNMTLNDTIESGLSDVSEPYYIIVKNIDSLTINGSSKKLYYLNFGEVIDQDTFENYYRTILEDFGDIDKAPFRPWCLFSFNLDCSHEILCIEENGNIVYMNPEKDYCYINTIVSTSNQITTNSITVFPNPTTGFISLNNELNSSVFNGCIYNCNGNKIRNITLENKNSQIDLTSFYPAIYFLKINDKKGNYIIKRIIKI